MMVGGLGYELVRVCLAYKCGGWEMSVFNLGVKIEENWV